MGHPQGTPYTHGFNRNQEHGQAEGLLLLLLLSATATLLSCLKNCPKLLLPCFYHTTGTPLQPEKQPAVRIGVYPQQRTLQMAEQKSQGCPM